MITSEQLAAVSHSPSLNRLGYDEKGRTTLPTFFSGVSRVGIVVACRCGQAFEADLYLAGKVVQCPACRSPIAIPTPAPELPPSASYIPRPRTVVSRESRDATESITKILVAGGVLLVMVLGLSVGIMCYLQGTNPVKWIAELGEQGKKEREARAAARAALAGEQSSSSPLDGPIPASGPATISGLPEGWGTFTHQEGKFSVIFPAGPESIDRDVESVAGVQSRPGGGVRAGPFQRFFL